MKENKENKSFNENLDSGFKQPTNVVEKKMLTEYGAIFVAGNGGAISPNSIIFKDEAEVADWQNSVESSKQTIGGFEIELQTSAMKALQSAIEEAGRNNLTITPRGSDAARRSYAETVELWASRVNPALTHWTEKEKITENEAEKIRSLSPFEQVPEIFKLEAEGIFFSKDLSKSIIYSVAPPGTSQHLAMLALDVQEHANADVRKILAKHFWFQTVVSDLPHFTFLGIPEDELPNFGLKSVTDGERIFWIPDL